MPANKRQHYVPKFLLKNFSISGGGKQINVYNLKADEEYPAVPLKNQAYKDYFYGEDGILEENFGRIETEAAYILRKITNSNIIPENFSEEHEILLVFLLSLSSRTLYNAEEVNEFANKIAKNIASHHPKLKDHLDEFEVSYENPILIMLEALVGSFPIISDLRMKLLHNKTELSFIISDNPVVFYNQFLEERNPQDPNIGLATKGLEIFLPLSPQQILILYDHNVYKVGSSKKIIIELNDINDVFSLCGLQYLNANKNIYYNEKINLSVILELIKVCANFRRKSKIDIKEFINPKYPKEALLRMNRTNIKCKLSLSCVKVLNKAKSYNLRTSSFEFRDENIINLYREFQKLVKKNLYKEMEFYKFLSDLDKIAKN